MATFKKINLKLSEVMELEAELFGLRNQQTGEVIATGLLNQKLPIKTKYWLSRLGNTIQSEKKTIDGLRDDLVKKYGTESEDKQSYFIPMSIESKKKDADGKPVMIPNPALAEFNTEYKKLLDVEKEIEHTDFKIEEFLSLETNENYAVFFKLISIEEETPA